MSLLIPSLIALSVLGPDGVPPMLPSPDMVLEAAKSGEGFFVGKGETLGVIPDLTSEDIRPDGSRIITFNAVWNYNAVQAEGQQSMTLQVYLDCTAQRYVISATANYAGRDGQGDFLSEDMDRPTDPVPLASDQADDLLVQAAEQLCK